MPCTSRPPLPLPPSPHPCQCHYPPIRRNHSKLGPSYVDRYMQGEDALTLCEAVDLPPCRLMRLVMEALPSTPDLLPACPDAADEADSPRRARPQRAFHMSPAEAKAAMADPHSVLRSAGAAPPPPARLRLAADLERSIAWDGLLSPRVDAARAEAGAAFEALLEARLRRAGISYQSEASLRAQNFAKTPDARLDVPVLVRGRVVHWIDSKAGKH